MPICFKRSFLCVCCFLLAGLGAASGGERQFSGDVTIDGKQPQAPVTLIFTVLEKEISTPYVYEVVTDNDGQFVAKIDAGEGAHITLKAKNPSLPQGDENLVLMGSKELEVAAADIHDVKLVLARVRARILRFRVFDQHDAPVPAIPARCTIYPVEDIKRNSSLETVKTATDQDGRFSVLCVPGDLRAREFEVASNGFSGDFYSGRLRLVGDKLQAAFAEETKLRVTREDLAIVVSIQWDPDLSDKPFEPYAQDPMGRTLKVNGLPDSEQSMTMKGEVRLYDIPAGPQVLALGQRARVCYKITRGTEKVVVPEKAEWPLKHVLTVAPASPVEARYEFSNSRTGRAVKDVKVFGQLGGAVSDDLGLAVLEGLAGEKLAVRCEGYRPTELTAPQKSEAAAVKVSLMPFPKVSGKVTEKTSKIPIKFGHIEFRGPVSTRAVSDEFGRYSIQLPAGMYEVSITGKVRLEELVNRPDKAFPTVLLYEGNLVVEKDDKPVNFEVPAVCALTVKVELAADLADKPEQAASFVVLMKPGTSKGVTYEPFRDGSAKVYAAQGKYRLLVAASEAAGFLAQELDLDKQEVSATVKVPRWERMQYRPHLQFRFEGSGKKDAPVSESETVR